MRGAPLNPSPTGVLFKNLMKIESVATKPGCSGAAHAIRLEIALFAEGKRFSSHRTGLSLGSSDPRRANLESDPVTLLQSPFQRENPQAGNCCPGGGERPQP